MAKQKKDAAGDAAGDGQRQAAGTTPEKRILKAIDQADDALQSAVKAIGSGSLTWTEITHHLRTALENVTQAWGWSAREAMRKPTADQPPQA